MRARLLALGVFMLVVLGCCGFVGLDAWRAWDARQSAIAEDTAETANLARFLSQHAHDTIQAVDSVLLSMREAAEQEGLTQAGKERLARLMRTQAQALPEIHGLLVLDPTGRDVIDSIPVPHEGVDDSDRGYFRYHRDHPDRALMVGALVHAKTDGTWVVTVSRRLDTADGGFAGVVVGSIALSALERFYGGLDIGGRGVVVLMATDGTVLALSPSKPDLIGTSVTRSDFFTRVLPRAASGTAEFLSALDGRDRIGSYEKVDGFPLIVLVSHPRSGVLTLWRKRTGLHLVVSLSAAGMLALLGGCLALQVRRRLATEARLEEQERHYRMLAENGTDLITRLGPDLRRTYVSPACRSLLGYEPHEMLGQTPEGLVFEEDRPVVAQALAQAVADGKPSPVCYRMLRKDGTPLWVEAVGRRIEDDGSYLIAIRDISIRKSIERDLHDANERLRQLVMLDGLTGIGNRRSFDTELEQEMRAAVRSGLPLSLLLIDIDHFKRLNDTYGHGAGDECLKLIAVTIGAWMKRPGDHLARYGGEEFVVLLPQTESYGAALMAEWLCEAVRSLDLSHIAPPARDTRLRTSISIGVATFHPGQGAAVEGHRLVEAADKALYAAKQGGRDRAVVSDAMTNTGTDRTARLAG